MEAIRRPHRLDRDTARSLRNWGDMLCLWRLCGRAACRRAQRCRGEAPVCFPRNFPLLPEGVRAWFGGIAQAQEDGLTFEQAIEWLDSHWAGDAYHDWCEMALTPPSPPAPPGSRCATKAPCARETPGSWRAP